MVPFRLRVCHLSWSPLPSGPVVALELNGDGVVEACQVIAKEVFSGTTVEHVTMPT